jgi:hypothetical protein
MNNEERLITQRECQEMIDAAIRRHNRNASIISMCVGWVVLALFAEGLLRLVGVYTTCATMVRHYPEIIGIVLLLSLCRHDVLSRHNDNAGQAWLHSYGSRRSKRC